MVVTYSMKLIFTVQESISLDYKNTSMKPAKATMHYRHKSCRIKTMENSPSNSTIDNKFIHG